MKQLSSLIKILALILLIQNLSGCKISVKVRSIADIPFKIKFSIPSIDSETEEVQFNVKGEQKQVEIEGPNCIEKPWIIQTFKQEGSEWRLEKESVAKLDGNGHLVVEVNDFLDVKITERFGVFCGESIICG